MVCQSTTFMQMSVALISRAADQKCSSGHEFFVSPTSTAGRSAITYQFIRMIDYASR